MRGVWVATVANIDWPSRPGLKVKEQKQEVRNIINHCKALGLNTIFLQVRPASDVLYRSRLEPWSKVLTGEAGKRPGYDPLQYWLEQAHQQGLELHAWINPYRAALNQKDPLPPMHPYHQRPDMFVEYGGKLYYNPGHPQANVHINRVVKELIENYDIDGIHMDDYFYPYPIQGEVFPDSVCFEKYGQSFEDINAWRRHNVNETVQSIRSTIKTSKPWLAFGISPFGVWRNKSDDPRGSESMAGTSNYDGLHADILLWMERKWIDYVVPQLYWGTSHTAANYNSLSAWWGANHSEVPVYIGHGIYKIGSDRPDWQDRYQIPRQLQRVRSHPNLNGSVYFSYKHFKRDLMGLQDSLANRYYRAKALVPSSTALEGTRNEATITRLRAGRRKLKWRSDKDASVRKYIIYRYRPFDAFNIDDPSFIFDVVYDDRYKLPRESSGSRKVFLVRVAAVDAYNNEGPISEPVRINF
ncbi:MULTISPECIES: glycoside hydrolase family 10 protein [unclassified Carboxylicivirga]|uniref:glycoside hydrolase family 10 protein n=1 Tax=Carboxylicivirga TaxID=1628153 RepID=UPI003D33E61A